MFGKWNKGEQAIGKQEGNQLITRIEVLEPVLDALKLHSTTKNWINDLV